VAEQRHLTKMALHRRRLVLGTITSPERYIFFLLMRMSEGGELLTVLRRSTGGSDLVHLEFERLDLQHNFITEFDNGKLILAPYVPRDGDRILESGTGTGKSFPRRAGMPTKH
jgi:hypothetical protein